MLIKNLTSKKQKVEVREIIGDHREYDIFVEPGGSTNIDRLLKIVNPERYAGIFDIGDTPAISIEKPQIVEPQVVADPEPVVETPAEEPIEETPESFVCDICGAEFASARGLTSHKNKAHAE